LIVSSNVKIAMQCFKNFGGGICPKFPPWLRAWCETSASLGVSHASHLLCFMSQAVCAYSLRKINGFRAPTTTAWYVLLCCCI